MLVQRGLLSYNPEDHKYETTSKGEHLLYACNELFQSLPPVNEMVEKYRLPLIA